MYAVREGFGVLRIFKDYNEAYERYMHITKTDHAFDVELYELCDPCTTNLALCLQQSPGNYIEIISDTAEKLIELNETLKNTDN